MIETADDPHLATLIQLALSEDGVENDLTSHAVVPESAVATAALIAREPGVIAGLFLLFEKSPLLLAFRSLSARVHVEDGLKIVAGEVVAQISGNARELLGLERALLNFLQRLSGIATETRRYVDAVAGTKARIQETRKTCPGWRILDKYAVRLGGGLNHRQGLHDQILIKENHLRFWPGLSPTEAIKQSLREARSRMPATVVLEIEVEDLAQFEAALEEKPDVIMLDDFAEVDIARAVALRNDRGEIPLLEVSGGVRLDRVATLANLGVDRISVGALTHSVRALDLALKIVPEPLRAAPPHLKP